MGGDAGRQPVPYSEGLATLSTRFPPTTQSKALVRFSATEEFGLR